MAASNDNKVFFASAYQTAPCYCPYDEITRVSVGPIPDSARDLGARRVLPLSLSVERLPLGDCMATLRVTDLSNLPVNLDRVFGVEVMLSDATSEETPELCHATFYNVDQVSFTISDWAARGLVNGTLTLHGVRFLLYRAGTPVPLSEAWAIGIRAEIVSMRLTH